MKTSNGLGALRKFASDIEHDKGSGAFASSTLTDFYNWTVRYSANAFSDEYLRDISEALLVLCILIKTSTNYETDTCKKMAGNLFLFSQELQDQLENWGTAVTENDVRYSKDQVRLHQSKLLDALKRFDDLCSPPEFSEWVKQRVKNPQLASTESRLTQTSAENILHRIDELRVNLNERLDDIQRGQAFIYQHIGTEAQASVNSILNALQQNEVEQGEIQRTLDAIRRVLKHIQSTGLPLADKEVKKSLDEIYKSLNSNLDLQQQLELSLPIIPFLMEYKIGLGAGVDLEAVWKELIELVRKNRDGT